MALSFMDGDGRLIILVGLLMLDVLVIVTCLWFPVLFIVEFIIIFASCVCLLLHTHSYVYGMDDQ